MRLGGGWETFSSGTIHEGSEAWYKKEKKDDDATDADYTDHIEEKKSWKKGAGVTDPYDTYTLHVWGDALEDSYVTPKYQKTPYDNMPFQGDPGLTYPEWIEGSAADPNNEGVTYFDGPGEQNNPKSWDLHWKHPYLSQPAAQPKADGSGPARGTGSIDAGFIGGDILASGAFQEDIVDVLNRSGFDQSAVDSSSLSLPPIDHTGQAVDQAQVPADLVRLWNFGPEVPAIDPYSNPADIVPSPNPGLSAPSMNLQDLLADPARMKRQLRERGTPQLKAAVFPDPVLTSKQQAELAELDLLRDLRGINRNSAEEQEFNRLTRKWGVSAGELDLGGSYAGLFFSNARKGVLEYQGIPFLDRVNIVNDIVEGLSPIREGTRAIDPFITWQNLHPPNGWLPPPRGR